jgi:hypothetical protein
MLERVLARDSGHLILFFDEPVRWDRETRMEIQTVDSAAGSLNVKTTYVDPMQPGQVHVITESQIPQARYICSMIHVTDPSGNPVDSAWSRMEFSGSASPDTLKPRLTRALPAAGELHAPVYGFLDLVFDDAMDMSTFAEGVSLSDTLGNVIQGETVWENPARVRFVPGGPLQSRTWYRVGLSGDLIRDGSGNALMDTLYSFRTQDRDTLSAIAGTVGDPDSTGSGPVIVLARQVENTKVEYRVRLDGPGSFHLDPVLPGLYILSAFRDSDGDGAYSQGWPYPFNPAERFHVFVDTVKVRSRWPNEGNYLLLPR